MKPAPFQRADWHPALVTGYTEIHWRRSWFPWHPLYRAWPEVLFDIPWRLPRGSSHLPLFLIVKDAQLHPARLESIRVEFAGPPGSCFSVPFEADLDREWHAQVFRIPLPPAQRYLRCRVRFTLRQGNRRREFVNDIYPGRYRPFTIYLNQDDTPRLPGFRRGDLHWHSCYSRDQVEFGAPLPLLQEAMRALELDFTAVTDHSYDFDTPGNWERRRREVEQLNAADPERLLLAAEEVSVRSSRERNIHLLLLGHEKLVPGSGDSGRNWQRRSEYALPQVLEQLTGEALAIAAHPRSRPGWLERVLLLRSAWDLAECDQLNHLQVANGGQTSELEAGLALWREQLTRGRRTYIVAGNDAHGDFNQSRRMRIPFSTIERSERNRTGGWQTVVRVSHLEPEAILTELRQGRSLITEGPLLSVEQAGEFRLDRLCFDAACRLHLASSEDYGFFTELLLHSGGKQGERSYPLTPNRALRQDISLQLPVSAASEYIRFSARTAFGHRLFSNPLYRQ